MIGILLHGLMSFIGNLLTIITTPISAAISVLFPSLDSAFSFILSNIDRFHAGMAVAWSWLAIPDAISQLMYLLIVMGLTVQAIRATMGVWTWIKSIKIW